MVFALISGVHSVATWTKLVLVALSDVLVSQSRCAQQLSPIKESGACGVTDCKFHAERFLACEEDVRVLQWMLTSRASSCVELHRLPPLRIFDVWHFVYGFSEGSICAFTDRFLDAFFETFHLFSENPVVHWPRDNELEEIRRGFILFDAALSLHALHQMYWGYRRP